MSAFLLTLQDEFFQKLKQTESSVRRHYQFPQSDSLIKVAIGMRRSGKTYFLFQVIRDLIRSGVPSEQILYLNFEDDRILPLDQKQMGQLIDAWYSLNPRRHDLCCYFFFDEVQNVDGWALVLRRLLDTKNVQLYVTGSSAKLLSKEIATSLRGRSLTLEIAPYNYAEYLSVNQLSMPNEYPRSRKMQDWQKAYLYEYFLKGGFPAVQKMQSPERIETLQSYVETVIFRDIVERHKVTNIALLRYLIGHLLKNISSRFAVHKFYNDIVSQGYKVAKDTLYTYLNYLEDSFLIFPIPLFTESLRQAQTQPKKIYAVDAGLVAANTFSISGNLGVLLENLVYLDLRRQRKKVFYYQTKDGYEVDFVAQDIDGKCELIQVCWDLGSAATREREERALRQAEQELGMPGRIIDLETY